MEVAAWIAVICLCILHFRFIKLHFTRVKKGATTTKYWAWSMTMTHIHDTRARENWLVAT